MHILIKECESCDSLASLYDKVECTILYLAKNKDNSLKYNVNIYFDQTIFNDLVRWKRILERRIHSCTYPCSSIKTSNIIAHVAKLAFRENCNLCDVCFPEESSSETSTTSTTTSNTP